MLFEGFSISFGAVLFFCLETFFLRKLLMLEKSRPRRGEPMIFNLSLFHKNIAV